MLLPKVISLSMVGSKAGRQVVSAAAHTDTHLSKSNLLCCKVLLFQVNHATIAWIDICTTTLRLNHLAKRVICFQQPDNLIIGWTSSTLFLPDLKSHFQSWLVLSIDAESSSSLILILTKQGWELKLTWLVLHSWVVKMSSGIWLKWFCSHLQSTRSTIHCPAVYFNPPDHKVGHFPSHRFNFTLLH